MKHYIYAILVSVLILPVCVQCKDPRLKEMESKLAREEAKLATVEAQKAELKRSADEAERKRILASYTLLLEYKVMIGNEWIEEYKLNNMTLEMWFSADEEGRAKYLNVMKKIMEKRITLEERGKQQAFRDMKSRQKNGGVE